jgi:hypothetical protein
MSSRRRSDTRPRVAALLTLAFLLVLACQYSSYVLEHKGLVYHGLEIKDTLPLLLVGIYIIGSIAGKLCETSDILAHHHGPLLQILELLLLELDNTLGYVMRSERHLGLIPVDGVGFFISFYIGIPPIRCEDYKLVRSK